jgi:hypothetical protein
VFEHLADPLNTLETAFASRLVVECVLQCRTGRAGIDQSCGADGSAIPRATTSGSSVPGRCVC